MSVGVIPHRTLTTRPPKVISNQRGGGDFSAPRPNFLGFLPRPVRPAPKRPAPRSPVRPAPRYSAPHIFARSFSCVLFA